MDKRKQMLDSLDAAFASKKPKFNPPKSVPGKVANAAPSKKKGSAQPSSKLMNIKMEHQAKARDMVKKAEPRTEKVNPLYAPLGRECFLDTRSREIMPRSNFKALEERLAALALVKSQANNNDEQLLDKVKSKVLQLDNPHKTKTLSQFQNNEHIQMPHRMSMKARRKRGFHASEASIEYFAAEELHRLWEQYMVAFVSDLTGNKCATAPALSKFQNCSYGAKLLKADYRGCMLRGRMTSRVRFSTDVLIPVVRSSNTGLIGASGIVLEEQANTFRVVSKNGSMQCFPKSNTTFAFDVDAKTFHFQGDAFSSRYY
ncbi:Aste57867_8413 [Aphanomyces stellatus]|uniref:Aste57867_8413 protein n=1 Tax=Aphanomyces stellatus TaxID=120398 RepID=A0A485KK92_9STRA|nr:hypothetical protein As57867_008381 [Aphanomyces stellatus]VFT85299.1 Aste57867_8413 [Aphanomyces stellatus]